MAIGARPKRIVVSCKLGLKISVYCIMDDSGKRLLLLAEESLPLLFIK